MQILSSGQRVTFEHQGNGYIFTVTQVAVEGQDETDVERGMLSEDSYIVFEASKASGIKVLFLLISGLIKYLLLFCFNSF